MWKNGKQLLRSKPLCLKSGKDFGRISIIGCGRFDPQQQIKKYRSQLLKRWLGFIIFLMALKTLEIDICFLVFTLLAITFAPLREINPGAIKRFQNAYNSTVSSQRKRNHQSQK